MISPANIKRFKRPLAVGLILMAAFFFFVQHIDVHGMEYRDDEIFYFQSVQEMIRGQNWLSPTYYGEHRFQKPILFYWLVILSSLAGGLGWFSARLVSVGFAALTVTLTWILARQMFHKWTAVLSCMILMTFPMFFRHAKNVVPDMTLNFFIVAASVAAWHYIQDPDKKIYRILFFVTCALGFMVKGFAAIVVPFLTLIIYAVSQKRLDLLRRLNFPAGLLLMLVIILPWFVYMGLVHGQQYFDFMVRQETMNRLVNPEQPNMLVQIFQTLKVNVPFYLGVLATHFSPWSLFIVPAVPFIFMRIRPQKQGREPLVFLTIWTGIVFLFFSFVFFHINHYLLVLSTPLALLLAFFLVEGPLSRPGGIGQRMLKGVFVFLLFLGFLSISLVFVYLAGLSFAWLVVYGIGIVGMIILTIRARQSFLPPVLLGLFLIVVLFQSDVISRSGLCPHVVYQDLAFWMRGAQYDDYTIDVASHSLHEKELQVYFQRRVIKTGHGHEPLTRQNLIKFLKNNESAFIVITAEDHDRYEADLVQYQLKPIIRTAISRKSYDLDVDFLRALFRLDREGIRAYIMQPILLLRKDRHV